MAIELHENGLGMLDFQESRSGFDSQAVLGGVVSYAILGQHIGKRAALHGAAFGTLLILFLSISGMIKT